jgi:glyoxylase-like metal-dependent hydrolase (beta-lactamase superfamily II)/rhodanese-related sulfurtransferase
MHIHQFYDDGLAHASYAFEADGKVIFVDPARHADPYLEYAKTHELEIVGIIETHPHADFASSHLELHLRAAAPIYCSRKTEATYPHEGFDEGDTVQVGDYTLRALNTPGHSPDSICIVVEGRDGTQHAVFTGDTLFVGDVGRPDLREGDGTNDTQKKELARAMFRSLNGKLRHLDRGAVVYPAHGPGSLCGKGAGDQKISSIGQELDENPAFAFGSEDDFVRWLLADQPFVPQYFPYGVKINKQGLPKRAESLERVPRLAANARPDSNITVVDTRDEAIFKKGYFPNSLNIQGGNKFETWLGSLVAPEEPYYLVAANEEKLGAVLEKAAKIGYETFVEGAFALDRGYADRSIEPIDLDSFKANPTDYTIVDVRNASEVEENGLTFDHAVNLPLPELADRTDEIPATDKPIVVHCAGGYRSAAAASIVARALPERKVLDLSEAVNEF